MRFFKRIKMNVLATAALYIVLGLLFMLLPGVTERIICYLIAGALALAGIAYIVDYFRSFDTSMQSNGLAVGILLVLAALFLFLKTSLVMEAIPILLGIAVIVSGVIKVQNAVVLYRMRNKAWIAALVLALLCLALGVVLIEDPFTDAHVLITVIGASLLFSGVTDLAMLLVMTRKAKEVKKAVQEATQDVLMGKRGGQE